MVVGYDEGLEEVEIWEKGSEFIFLHGPKSCKFKYMQNIEYVSHTPKSLHKIDFTR
jgi:hypothetical protein